MRLEELSTFLVVMVTPPRVRPGDLWNTLLRRHQRWDIPGTMRARVTFVPNLGLCVIPRLPCRIYRNSAIALIHSLVLWTIHLITPKISPSKKSSILFSWSFSTRLDNYKAPFLFPDSLVLGPLPTLAYNEDRSRPRELPIFSITLMPPIVVGTSNIRTDRTNPASTASMATLRMSTGVRGITIQKILSSTSMI